MPEQTPQTDPWTSLLNLLSKIITPDWSDVIAWLPLMLSALVVLVLAYTAYRWWRVSDVNRSRVPRPFATAVAPPGVHMPGPSRWPFVVPIGGTLILFGLAIRPTDATGQPTAPVNVPVLAAGLAITAIAIVGWLRDAMREWRRAEGLPEDRALVAAPAGTAALPPGVRIGAFPVRHAASGTSSAAAALAPPREAIAPAVGVEREPPPGVHMPGPSPWPFFVPIALTVVFFGLVISPVIVVGGIVMVLVAAVGWLRDAGHEYRQVNAGHAAEPRTRDPERAFPKKLLGLYAAIGLLSLALMAAPGIVAFANRTPGEGGGAPGGGPGTSGAPTGPISISANKLQFSTKELRVPAEKPFSLTFDNKEAVPHNVAIYTDSGLGTPLFTGEIITGPRTVTYQVTAIAAGEHYFVCNVHPNMNGTVVAQ